MHVTLSRPLTAKEQQALAVLQGALVGFVANGAISLVSPADFSQVMHRPTADQVLKTIRGLLDVMWTPKGGLGNSMPIILAYGSRDGTNAVLVEFSRAYIDTLDGVPRH